MFSFLKKRQLDTTKTVDKIENIVHSWAKPLGFKKHGRTLHRFVDGNISQVINFQNGCPEKQVYGVLWVNLGIRVPECSSFPDEQKAYYKEYECNIRCRLDEYVDKKVNPYKLSDDPQKTANDIIEKIERFVIPVFDTLSSRESIADNLENFPDFNSFRNHLIRNDVDLIIKHMKQSNPEQSS